jgi:hypothetical protein
MQTQKASAAAKHSFHAGNAGTASADVPNPFADGFSTGLWIALGCGALPAPALYIRFNPKQTESCAFRLPSSTR